MADEVRKRKNLKPQEKLDVYKEATVARLTGNGAVGTVLRKWGIHSSDLSRITRTVEEGALAQFKARRSRKKKVTEEDLLEYKEETERLQHTVIELAAELALIKKKGI
jgi:hypothetical protein